MRTKLNDIYLSTSTSEYDVIFLSETWLTPDIADSEVFSDSFNVYRKDRNVQTSDKQRGGGVLIAVRSGHESFQITVDAGNVEHVFVRVDINRVKFIFGCVYIPPKSSSQMYYCHAQAVKTIMEKYVNDNVIIFGDYNMPNLVWNCNTMLVSNICNESEKLICDEFSLLGLSQLNFNYNMYNSLLDLCFSNSYVIISECNSITTQSDKYHPPLEGTLSFQSDLLRLVEEVRYNFNAADYGGLNNYLLSYNWLDLYALQDLNDITDYFYKIMQDAITIFVPTYVVKKSNFPSWFSPQLKAKVRSKKIAHKNYKETKRHRDYVKFQVLRSECKELTKICYQNFVSNMEERMNVDVSDFWKFVNSKNRGKGGIPQSMFLGDIHVEGGEQIVNLFASHFNSIYQKFTEKPTLDRGETFNTDFFCGINAIEFTFDNVLNTLLSLNVKKGAGPDNIPNIMLRECAVSMCEPLLFIFNKSFKLGIFPEKWKCSYVSPIFKSGNNCDVSNYRPICIQSAIPKVLEKMFLPLLESAFKNVIVEHQHGFVNGRSTMTNLFSYANFIGNALDDGFEVHSIYTDFSKAFDMVDHGILLEKLSSFGIGGALLSWISSYLEGRTLQVKLNGFLSSTFNAISGVPQGSHLGPKLFLLLVNDIGDHFESNYLLFADDLKIFRSIKSDSDSVILQNDINKLLSWCKTNNLHLNISKCSYMIFSRNKHKSDFSYKMEDQILVKQTVVKDLGIYFDGMINFRHHYEYMIGRANRMLGFVMRMSHDFHNWNSIVSLFVSYVRSILEYGSVIWSPWYDIHRDRIEAVQVKFLKYLRFRMHRAGIISDIHNIRRQYGLYNLNERRNYLDMCFLYKIMNSLIISPDILGSIDFFIPTVHLRRHPLIFSRTCSTRHSQNMPLNRLVALCNNFHNNVDFVGNSLSSFKRKLREITFCL